MGGWIEQNRPAPQFEYEQIVAEPPAVVEAPPDLEAMAYELDQMKIEAAIDAERTRPGLNGLFALVLVTPLIYIGVIIADYQAKAFATLFGPLQPLPAAIALGSGLIITSIVALVSYIATRRSRARVGAFQRKLISLGGKPLPERGRPLPQ